MDSLTKPSPTNVGVDFLIILHFPKIHVVNHQRLPHGKFTLSQNAQHPLILCESEQNYSTFYDSDQILLGDFREMRGNRVGYVELAYPSSGVPGELHHFVKLFRSKLIRRSSPAPSPSMRRRFRITSSGIRAK